ncbi:MAG: hypothetical protein R2825_03830 [Saprospiraceae bacterium]
MSLEKTFVPSRLIFQFLISKYSKQNKATNITFGRHPVTDAIKSGSHFDKVIFIQRGTVGDFEIEVRKLCSEHEIPLQYV